MLLLFVGQCIPGTFMEEYPNSVQKGKPVTLEGPSGNKWKVGATNRSILHHGWRAFAHDHRLKEGDQLNFRLTKPSHFVVDIFNSHGEVRRSARKAIVTGKYAVAAPGTPHLQDQSRKRKDMAEAGIGNNGTTAIVDRWKRGISFNEPTVGHVRLRFSEKTKQWESHEEEKEDHVITIDLDSDDDEVEPEENSTRQQNYRSSKIERLIEHMKEEETLKPIQRSKPTVDAKRHQEIIPGDGEEDYVAHHHDPLDEEQQRPSDPLRQFTTIFDTTSMETLDDLQETTEVVEKTVFKAEMGKVESGEARIVCDEDMVMVIEEEEETHLVDDEELDKTSKLTLQACVVVEKKNLETSIAEQDTPKGVEEKHQDLEADSTASNKVVQSYKTPLAHEAAADYESVTHKAVDANQVTIVTSITAMSEMYESELGTVNVKVAGSRPTEKMQAAEGGFSFGLTLDEFPVINDINGGKTDSVHPLKQGLNTSHERVDDDLDTLKDELHLTKSKNEDCIMSASEEYDLHVTKIEPGVLEQEEKNPNIPVSCDAENTKEKERSPSTYGNISNLDAADHEKEKKNFQLARVAPTSTNTCMLESKRGPVARADREKALKAAQAWARKIRNPNFVAVMKSSHVYTDFNMVNPLSIPSHCKNS